MRFLILSTNSFTYWWAINLSILFNVYDRTPSLFLRTVSKWYMPMIPVTWEAEAGGL